MVSWVYGEMSLPLFPANSWGHSKKSFQDIIKLPSMARLLDSVLELHQATSDAAGLAACQAWRLWHWCGRGASKMMKWYEVSLTCLKIRPPQSFEGLLGIIVSEAEITWPPVTHKWSRWRMAWMLSGCDQWGFGKSSEARRSHHRGAGVQRS